MKRLGLFLAGSLIFASGCNHTEAVDSQANANAKSWIGQPVASLISEVGEPQYIQPWTGGQKRYIWKNTATGTVRNTYTYNTTSPGPTPGSVMITPNERGGSGKLNSFISGFSGCRRECGWNLKLA